MKEASLIVLLIFLAGCPEVSSMNLGRCMDDLSISSSARTPPCTSTRNFAKCMFEEMKMDKLIVTESDKQTFQALLNAEMRKRGVVCHIDVRQILEEMSQDRRKGIVHTTKRPTGYHNAVTAGDCLNTFATLTDVVSCSSINPYLKCLFRVRELHKKFTELDFRAMENALQDLMDKHGLYCPINVKELMREIEKEEREKEERWEVHTTALPIPKHSAFSDADSLSDCGEALISQIIQFGEMNCDLMTSYAKCAIRVERIYKDSNTMTEQIVHHVLNDLARELGVHCPLHVRKLIREVAEEENGVYTTAETLTKKSNHVHVRIHTLTKNKEIYYTTARTIAREAALAPTISPGMVSDGKRGSNSTILLSGSHVIFDDESLEENSNKMEDDKSSQMKPDELKRLYSSQNSKIVQFLSQHRYGSNKGNEMDKNVILLVLLTVFSFFCTV